MTKSIKENVFAPLHNMKAFLAILVIGLSFLMYQPFGDILRGVLYGLLVVYTGIFFILNLRQRPLVLTPLSVCGIAFYIVSTISYAYSGDIMMVGFAHFQFILFALIAFSERKDEEIHIEILLISKILIIASLLMTILSVLSRPFVLCFPDAVELFPTELKRMIITAASINSQRLFGFGMQFNVTSSIVVTGIMLSFFLITFNYVGKKWKILSAVNIVISSFMVIFLCGSRTHTVVLICFFFCYPIAYLISFARTDKEKNKKGLIIFLALVFIFIITVLILMSIDIVREYVIKVVIRPESLETGSGRTKIWKYMFEISKGHRLLGVSRQSIIDKMGYGSHSIYMELLVVLGIPAMILFFFYFFGSLFYLGKNLLFDCRKDNKPFYFIMFMVLAMTAIQGVAEQYLFGAYTNPAIVVTFFLASAQVLLKHEKRDETY